ncbi:class I SAM-dependent methyltransferase [Planctomycetota bacterium]
MPLNKNIMDKSDNIISWILDNVPLRECTSAEFIYDRMESQSGKSLPGIYESFNAAKSSHFADRGSILDFQVSAGPGRILDFGPGDGWPALGMANADHEVVGVEGSIGRVKCCTANAKRMGIDNATFIHVPAGEALPFEEESFDGATASSSVEQAPEPAAVLQELYRVLRPGGCLRLNWESLETYRGGQETGLWILSNNNGLADMIVYDRNIDEEYVRQFRLGLKISKAQVMVVFRKHNAEISFTGLTIHILAELVKELNDAVLMVTRHPSSGTLLKWLADAGFSKAQLTCGGGWFASRLFDRIPQAHRPKNLEAVDAFLRPIVEVVVTMPALHDTGLVMATK